MNWEAKLCRFDGKPCACQSMGFTSLPVLEFLNDQPWDDRAKNLVHSLRPSSVRTSTGEVNTDSETWRVTVMLEPDRKTIQYITQEVEVGGLGCGENNFPGIEARGYVQSLRKGKERP